MRRIIYPLLFMFLSTGLFSCYTQIPIERKTPENNKTYKVEYLFDHEGVKVYRFYDFGNYVYFTTPGQGTMTSIKNDSTHQRTITIQKEDDPWAGY